MWLQDRDQELELLGCNESGPFYHLFYPLKNDLERYETFIEYMYRFIVPRRCEPTGTERCAGTVSFENVSARKDGSQLMMNFTTNLSNLRLKSQEMVILTPVLQSVDKSQSYQFNPIVITGRARMKALNRELGFDSYNFPKLLA